MKVDDYGRYYGDAQLLKSYLFPRKDVRTADISRWVAECETSGLIVCYVGADGKPYAAIRNFNQRMRAKKSRFPAPPDIKPSIKSEQPYAPEEPTTVNPGVTLAMNAPAGISAPRSGEKHNLTGMCQSRDGYMTVTCQTNDSHMTARDERREIKKETTSLKKVSLRDEEAEAEEEAGHVPENMNRVHPEELRTVQAVEKLAAAYPKRFAIEAGKRSALKVLKRLIDGGESPEEAEARLLEAVKSYAVFYRSVPEAKKRYTWSMEKFFEAGHYDDDPALWNLSDDENANAPDDGGDVDPDEAIRRMQGL